MTLKELKERLAALVVGELESLGLSTECGELEDVRVMTSSNTHNKKHGEVVWIASVNSEEDKVIIIANGMLYTEEEILETGKNVEVGRIYVNREKAEMLVEALKHAFPELLSKEYCRRPSGSCSNPGENLLFDWSGEHTHEGNEEGECTWGGSEDVAEEAYRELAEHLKDDEHGLELASRLWARACGDVIEPDTSQNPCGEFIENWSPLPSKINTISSDRLIDTYKDVKNKILNKISEDSEKVTLTSFSDGKISTFVGTVPGSKNVELIEVNIKEMAKNGSNLKQITIKDKRVLDEIVTQFEAG